MKSILFIDKRAYIYIYSKAYKVSYLGSVSCKINNYDNFVLKITFSKKKNLFSILKFKF